MRGPAAVGLLSRSAYIYVHVYGKMQKYIQLHANIY